MTDPATCSVIVLPAAGESRRMRGADKLLEPVYGQTLLRRQVARAIATGASVAVTLRPDETARRAALEGLEARLIDVPDASEGMAASLRAGALWARECGARAVMIVLPDMPDITTDDMKALLSAQRSQPDQPLRAAGDTGIPGNPVVIPARMFAALAVLRGDTGARDLLRDARLLPLEGARALIDLDTPEAWAGWRARQG